MRPTLALLCLTGLLVGVSAEGCPFFIPRDFRFMTVEIVNESDVTIRAVVRHDHDGNIDQPALLNLGVALSRIVEPGGTGSVTLPCHEAGALLLAEVEGLEDGGVTLEPGFDPVEEQAVLRVGTDFECNDTIRFTISVDETGTDLDVATEVIGAD